MNRIYLNENTLTKLIKSAINEVMLGQNDRFTPYTPEQAKMNKSHEAFDYQNNKSYLDERSISLHIKEVKATPNPNTFEFDAELITNKDRYKGTYENGNVTLSSITSHNGEEKQITDKINNIFQQRMAQKLIPQIKARIARGAVKTLDKTNLSEAKRRLASNKIHNILKQHGGLYNREDGIWLADVTDNDIITILPPNNENMIYDIYQQYKDYLNNGGYIDYKKLGDKTLLVYKIDKKRFNDIFDQTNKSKLNHDFYQKHYSPMNDKGFERNMVKMWKQNGVYKPNDPFKPTNARPEINKLKNNRSIDGMHNFDNKGNYIY